MTLCECGCGGEVKPGNRFIQGHYSKIHPPMKGVESIQKGLRTYRINKEIKEGKRPAPESKYCACGCGQIVKPGNKYIYEHYGNTKKGKTKYNDEECMRVSIALTGRTKETHKYLIRTGRGRKGLTKETDEGRRKQAEALIGRTKETHEHLRNTSEKLTGRTKENDESVRRRAEKLTGRTKENDERVRKMSEVLTGRVVSEKTCQKMSDFWSGKTGEKSNAWKGGTSYFPYCEKFNEDLKERVRIFFDRKCYVCGKSEQEQIDEMINDGKRPLRRLDVHHVNYNKNTCCDNSKPLFVPLCRSCHMKTHGDREYWEEFFTVSLEYLTKGECFIHKKEIGEKENEI